MKRAFSEDHKWLVQNKFLKGLPKEDFIQKMTEFHTRIDEIHPFREGNGRAIQTFLSQLAK